MSTILNKAANAAHQTILKQADNGQRYSQFPVHEAAFWEHIFAAAKNAKTAHVVLKELEIIEAEPCIENERVWTNVRTARSKARLTLMN
jgi:hypothetical protein